MPIVDITGERRKRQVMKETWGHLAPKKGRTYKGYIVWAYSDWGDIVLLDADFKNLNDSPWLFEAMQEFIGENIRSGEGVYKLVGQYCKEDDDCHCFGGEIKKLDFKDIFPRKS